MFFTTQQEDSCRRRGGNGINDRVWNGNGGANWKDRDRDRYRDKDIHMYRNHHSEFRKPTGYGKQGWHMYTEDFARGTGPSKPNKRIFDNGSCLPIGNYGRESSRDIRGGSFSQRDWRGHCWDDAPGSRSNGYANMPAHASAKRSADDMLAYNSYPHSNIGNNWDQFHFKDQHYKNGVVNGPHTNRRFGRKNSVGLNVRKPLKWTRSGSMYSRGCSYSHSSSPKSLGLDTVEIKAPSHLQNQSPVYSLSGKAEETNTWGCPKSLGLDSDEIKVPSHLQNLSPVRSLSGKAAVCAAIAPSEETNSHGYGLSPPSSPIYLGLDSGEITVPLHPHNPSLVHSLSGNAAAAKETNSSGCGFSHSSSPKSTGSDIGEIKVPLHPQIPSPGHSLSGNTTACATVAPTEETDSRKKPRLGWGEGLALFEKIINVSIDTAENNGTIEALQSRCKNYTEPVHSLNSNVALRSSSIQCFTECPSPVTPSVACSSSPGEDKLSLKAVDVDTAYLCGSPCPESQNQRDGSAFNANLCGSPCPESQDQKDGSAFNLENLEVTKFADFSSSLSELLRSDRLHSVNSDSMRTRAMRKLLVLKADIAKKVEITESDIDVLENELKTLISDTGIASTCSTFSSSLPVNIVKPSEEMCATSKLILRPDPLGLDIFGDMTKKMSPGGLEGELAESRDQDIDSSGTATSKIVEPLLAGTLFSEKTLKFSESTWNVDAGGYEDREGKSILHADDEENLGATFSKKIARSRGCILSTDIEVRREHTLYDLLIASNKDSAHRAAEVFSKLLPTNLSVADYKSFDVSPCWKNIALVRENLARRKRFLRFKERVITLKYRASKKLWKEDMLHLFRRRSHLLFQKKFKLSSPVVHSSNLKHLSSIPARFSTRGK